MKSKALERPMKIFYIISWIPFILLKLVLVLLGLIAVPIALRSKQWPKLLWLWGNKEEGCPEWWYKVALVKGGFIEKFPRFWWYAVRNPVNNFRYIFDDREDVNTSGNWATESLEAHDLIRCGIHKAWRWTYSGFFAGYRVVWLDFRPTTDIELQRYNEFWIGWKVGSKVPGMGFAVQYRRHREVGK